MRSRGNSNSIFISPENFINFDNSIEVVKRCLNKESRIFISTRMADLDTYLELKNIND